MSAGASSNCDPYRALQKAMEEAEFNFLSWREFGKFEDMAATSIRKPTDHLLYYSSANNKDHLQWLFETSECESYSFPDIVDINSLHSINQTYFARLESKLIPEIYVHRALNKDLIPVHFGSSNYSCPKKRLNSLGLSLVHSQLDLPHFFS